MGTLIYPSRGSNIEIEDRTLAHLQVVIGSKLRLRQAFFFTWVERVGLGSGRISVWIDATIPIGFSYDTDQRHQINRAWLEALALSANSATGLQLIAEPEAMRLAEGKRRPDEVAA